MCLRRAQHYELLVGLKPMSAMLSVHKAAQHNLNREGTPVRTGLNGGTPNLQSSKAAAIDPGSKASMVMW